MRYQPKFNPDVDIFPVVEGMSTDVNEALRSGIVLDGTVDPESNELVTCGQIQGRVRDAFDAMIALNEIRKASVSGKPAPSETPSSDVNSAD